MPARLRSALTDAAPALLLPVCWLPAVLAGGAHVVPPLFFFVPIALVAVRGRILPAVAVALASALLAGPLTPHHAGEAQPVTDWLVRGGFFVVAAIGLSRLVGGMRRASLHDALTGLPNRDLFAEHLTAALARARRNGRAVALAYIDLDDFKLVNDHLGHAAGDDLLRAVADRLSSCTRDTDILARQGGDEFLLLLADLDDADAARSAARLLSERVRDALEEPFRLGGAELQITMSMGLSVFPEDASDAGTLHRHADAAMYRAKAAGGGMATYEQDRAAPLARLSLAARLRRAIDADELEVHYQPIFDLRTDTIMGVESLVRWRHPRRGLVPPGEFIPTAEQTGLIEAIADWVVDETCRQAAVWGELGLHPGYGVNISPRQLRRPDFAGRLLERVRANGLDESRLIVELTESAWTLEADRTLPVLQELREAGIVVALDDFGAGYSSLSRLLELPVDVIKVDRTFLSGVPERPAGVAILTAIQQLAAACGCDVVVEGVETDAQRALVAGMGCRLGQGFGLARPLPGAEVTGLLLDRLEPSRRTGPAATPATGLTAAEG